MSNAADCPPRGESIAHFCIDRQLIGLAEYKIIRRVKSRQCLQIRIDYVHPFAISGSVIHRLGIGICAKKIKPSSGAANCYLKGVVIRITDRPEPSITAEIGSTVSLAHKCWARAIVRLRRRHNVNIVLAERAASQACELQTKGRITGVRLYRREQVMSLAANIGDAE